MCCHIGTGLRGALVARLATRQLDSDKRTPKSANTVPLVSLRHIVAASLAMGADSFGGSLSSHERRLIDRCSGTRVGSVEGLQKQILEGLDPLGNALCIIRPIHTRRKMGTFYTPQPIVRGMVQWALSDNPARLVDPGCGSGRFAAEAIRNNRALRIVAVDIDPLATLVCRANLAVLRAKNATVVNADYTGFALARTRERTAFVSNPPYVRHHDLSRKQKAWAKAVAGRLALPFSGLAGLHVHFLLAALLQAQDGDIGCFITSAEWLDINYGKLMREAFVNGMGGVSLHLIDRSSVTFEDAMSTAAISCFEIGKRATTVRLGCLASAGRVADLHKGKLVVTSLLQNTSRWSPLFLARRRREVDRTLVPLGSVVRVSRGIATGANKYFVLERARAKCLGLEPYTVSALTRAKYVLDSDGVVRDDQTYRLLLAPRRTVDPRTREHGALRTYLNEGEDAGISNAYLCRHRTPWWFLDPKIPPIVATYMTRQGPAFALNPDGLAILNVLHGFFPKIALDDEQLAGLVRYLNSHRNEFRGLGRTYQGGLEKFEPREMEALLVPPPDKLRDYCPA